MTTVVGNLADLPAAHQDEIAATAERVAQQLQQFLLSEVKK